MSRQSKKQTPPKYIDGIFKLYRLTDAREGQYSIIKTDGFRYQDITLRDMEFSHIKNIENLDIAIAIRFTKDISSIDVFEVEGVKYDVVRLRPNREKKEIICILVKSQNKQRVYFDGDAT